MNSRNFEDREFLAGAVEDESLLERLAEEMADGWRNGDRPLAEDYLDRHPDLWHRLDAALELIAEELALREEYGEPVSRAELAERFPDWCEQVRTLGDCQRALGSWPIAPRFPEVGMTLGEFRLIAELGRGAHGCVFLATQLSLGERSVVLKLAPAAGYEHLSLARLQHTNIVPLHSTHEFPERGIRGLCMPYFGGATFAALLAAIGDQHASARMGTDLVDALRKCQKATPNGRLVSRNLPPAVSQSLDTSPTRGEDITKSQDQNQASHVLPSPLVGEGGESSSRVGGKSSPAQRHTVAIQGNGCDSLARVSYEVAICQIGVCLADALQFAHDRGLLHLDIKPSNILLAADGVPMLLDFHLARAPLPAGALPLESLGGTPGYMAPELSAAVQALRQGAPIPAAIDVRADVYSLGVLLAESLDGFPTPPNASIPVGLADILARCTDQDPANRYATARDVADDLRRHISDLPLKGVANRSVTERWRKWRRRQPMALPFVALFVALSAMCLGVVFYADGQAVRAEASLREGETRLREGRYVEAIEAARGGESLLGLVPFHRELEQKLRETRLRAECGQAATELHSFCERVRPLYATEVATATQLGAVESRCRELWAEREKIAHRLEGQLSAEAERQWHADLLDLGILTADLHARVAAPSQVEAARRQSLTILVETETLLKPSAALYMERAIHARALKQWAEADEATRQAGLHPPRTGWEHVVVGRSYLRTGDIRSAAREMDRCLELEPGSLWGNYYRGVCSLRLGEHTDAVAAFTACLALAPRSGWCYYNRGLANTEIGRLDRACADFDHALGLDSGLTSALLSRAVVHTKSGRYSEALNDLRLARTGGVSPATVAYHTATVKLAVGDKAAAISSLRECLAQEPTHREAQQLLDRIISPR